MAQLRLEIDPDRPDRVLVGRAAALIKAGGVVACPTDTLYGLAADATNPDAVAQVFRLKGRDALKSLPLVAFDRGQVEAMVGPLSPLGSRLADCFWPGPLSLIVRARPSLVTQVHGGLGTVAVRVPAHAVTRLLIELSGTPLTATSANPTGKSPARTAREVISAFGDQLEIVLDAGVSPSSLGSTIVDVTGHAPRLVRPGAIAWERVLESLQ